MGVKFLTSFVADNLAGSQRPTELPPGARLLVDASGWAFYLQVRRRPPPEGTLAGAGGARGVAGAAALQYCSNTALQYCSTAVILLLRLLLLLLLRWLLPLLLLLLLPPPPPLRLRPLPLLPLLLQCCRCSCNAAAVLLLQCGCCCCCCCCSSAVFSAPSMLVLAAVPRRCRCCSCCRQAALACCPAHTHASTCSAQDLCVANGVRQVSHGLQLQSLWRTPTAAVG